MSYNLIRNPESKSSKVIFENYFNEVRMISATIAEELYYLEYFDLLAVERDPDYREKMRGFLDSCLLFSRQLSDYDQVVSSFDYDTNIRREAYDIVNKDLQSELSRILSEDESELNDNGSDLRAWEYHRDNSIKGIISFDDSKIAVIHYRLTHTIVRQWDHLMREFERSESEYVRLYRGLLETDEGYDWLLNYHGGYVNSNGEMVIKRRYTKGRIILPWRTEFYTMMLMIPDRIARDENDLENLRRAARTLAFGCGRSLYEDNEYVLPQNKDIADLLN